MAGWRMPDAWCLNPAESWKHSGRWRWRWDRGTVDDSTFNIQECKWDPLHLWSTLSSSVRDRDRETELLCRNNNSLCIFLLCTSTFYMDTSKNRARASSDRQWRHHVIRASVINPSHRLYFFTIIILIIHLYILLSIYIPH